MIFLLDMNAVSDLVRMQPKIHQRVQGTATPHQIITCTIVRGEILYGISRLPNGRRRDDLELKVSHILGGITCVPVPEQAAEHYARVKIDRLSKGWNLDENDLWIIATALAMSATLISRDSDMCGIAGLLTEDWTT